MGGFCSFTDFLLLPSLPKQLEFLLFLVLSYTSQHVLFTILLSAKRRSILVKIHSNSFQRVNISNAIYNGNGQNCKLDQDKFLRCQQPYLLVSHICANFMKCVIVVYLAIFEDTFWRRMIPAFSEALYLLRPSLSSHSVCGTLNFATSRPCVFI